MVKFNHNGKEYTLEFNRKTALATERRGFQLDEIGSKPLSNLPLLVWGAFQKNHRKVTDEEAMKIFKSLNNRSELLNVLIEDYSATYTDLFGNEDSESGDGENLTNWEVR